MKITFDSKKHIYRVNEEIAHISITQLLRKHNLAPDFKGVKADVLDNAAKRGTLIHKDLENIINDKKTLNEYEPFTEEGRNFAKYYDSFIDHANAEQMLAHNYKGMWLCGTADVIGWYKDPSKGCFIADHKTTSAINREYVSWQVSIIDYILRHQSEPFNNDVYNWKGADDLMCYHYAKDGDLTVIKLNKVSDEEIERLFEAEYNGELYQRVELALDDEITGNLNNVLVAIDTMEDRLKKLKAQADKYKDLIKEKMEETGVKSFECDKFKITYIYPQDKMVVDSAKLKKDYPQVFEQCQKVSKVKAQLKITIKGEKEDE